MPPEKTYDWDEPKRMPYYMRGARSYFDFGNRNATDELTGSAGRTAPQASYVHLKSLLSRLGFFN